MGAVITLPSAAVSSRTTLHQRSQCDFLNACHSSAGLPRISASIAYNSPIRCWVPVTHSWSGNGYGFMSIPHIGQQVLISYLNGDIDRPVITGCMYNGRNAPPLDLPAQKTRTTFKTCTHKGEGFNELRFEDQAGQEEVYIHAQRDMNVHIQHD